MEVLKTYKRYTVIFSKCYHPTSHLVLPSTLDIVATFEIIKEEPSLTGCLEPLKFKWLKCMEYIPDVYLIASVLDPRLKPEGVSTMLEGYCGALVDDEGIPPVDFSYEVSKLMELFNTLYTEYDRMFGTRNVEVQNPDSSIGGTSMGVLRGLKNVWQKRQKTSSSSTSSSAGQRSELSRYLNTTFEAGQEEGYDFNFDILNWWKGHQKEFPALSHMAIEFLGCHVSTMSCERAFGIAGNVLTYNRCSLYPITSEKQICCNDWVKADDRMQDYESEDESQFEVSDTDTTGGGTGGRNTDAEDFVSDWN